MMIWVTKTGVLTLISTAPPGRTLNKLENTAQCLFLAVNKMR